MTNTLYPTKPCKPGVKTVNGFTLIETAIVIGIISILAGVSLLYFRNLGETQDAALANGVQGSLQTALGQLCLRLERTPPQVFNNTNFRQRIIQFAQGSMGPQAVLVDQGNSIRLRFNNSPRTVDYGMTPQGDMVVVAETFNFFNADAAGKLDD